MSFNFDAAVVAPFRMQPGLRRLREGTPQLSLMQADSRHLHEKLNVLLEHPRHALQRVAGFDAMPALAALARQAASEYPQGFSWDGETAAAHALGWAVCGGHVQQIDGAAALASIGECLLQLPESWRLAGLLALALEEDFAVLDTQSTYIPWLAVALPSHWDPRQKVGRNFAQVHQPVADNALLIDAARSLCRLVNGPQRWERFVWSITSHPDLDARPERTSSRRWCVGDAQCVAGQAHWRTERQTFIPLLEHAQALFTIRVNVQPLPQAIDSPAKAARVHDALASMSDTVLRYRALHEVREPLLKWLAERAAQP